MRLLVVYLGFVWFVIGCSGDAPTAPPRMVPEVDVAAPISARIDLWDEYTGRFEAVEQVAVRARVSGYLKSINFADGQPVEEGDVLFVIDQRPFTIALKSAKSRYDLAQKELTRGRDLRRKNSISQEVLDRRVSEFELASAELERAKLDLEFTQVKAPISGLVSRDLVNPGNLVNGSATNATLLTTIVKVDPIHFYFEAGEQELLKYQRLGQSNKRESSRTAANPVQVKLQDETEFVHKGVMDFVDNRIDPSTGTIQGRAIFNNEEGFILPGLFGRARLIAQKDYQAILIPDAAISSDQSRKYVFVVDETNKVSRKYIEIGDLYNLDLRVVESGLEGSETLVVNGIMRVRAGVPVTPKRVDLAAKYKF